MKTEPTPKKLGFARRLALMASILTLADMSRSLPLFATHPGLIEANPIMRRILNISEGAFCAAKLLLGCGGIWVLLYAAQQGAQTAIWGLIVVTVTLWTAVLLGIWGIFWLPATM